MGLSTSRARDAGAVLPDEWRVLRTAPAAGSWNMACDLTLLDLARAGRTGFLRVYGWREPTVSFGRNERTAGIFSKDALAAAGLVAVRRPTGGRALLHHREITYSVAVPVDHEVRWQHVYRAINEVLLRALVAMGVPAAVVETRPSSSPTHHASDVAPAAGVDAL
ncbi:MAG: lipoate--protein ligase family protein, partial [Phycisphaerae bacterium]|nr:lipoate--protein ligase family protein [Gemmatimonadaceae bacterium]